MRRRYACNRKRGGAFQVLCNFLITFIFHVQVDAVINDCLRLLTLNEIRHLLFSYLNNVTVMRKCSSEHDKQVSELDVSYKN